MSLSNLTCEETLNASDQRFLLTVKRHLVVHRANQPGRMLIAKSGREEFWRQVSFD